MSTIRRQVDFYQHRFIHSCQTDLLLKLTWLGGQLKRMLSSFYKMQAQRMTALHTFVMMLRNSMTVSLLMLLI